MSFLGFAAMKTIGGSAPGSWLERWGMHWPSVLVEIALGLAWFSRYWRYAANATLGLCAVAVIFGLVVRDGDCGCAGAWLTWSASLHVMVVSSGGVGCSVALLAAPRVPVRV